MNTSPSLTLSDSDSAPTRVRLILAAEEMFGEFGIEAASLRAICAAAGQKNISSVQYHFGNKYALFSAVLDYREQQIEPVRQTKLSEIQAIRHPDVRMLLRVLFEPYAQVYLEGENINFIKMMSSYVNLVRPRGLFLHPADYQDESYPSLRETMALLVRLLSFLDEAQSSRRLNTVGSMFWGALIQLSLAKGMSKRRKYIAFEDTLEMMGAAISAPPNTGLLSPPKRSVAKKKSP